MDNWDSLFPFTADEINLFSRLHQKATKFPAPAGIKTRSNDFETVVQSETSYSYSHSSDSRDRRDSSDRSDSSDSSDEQ